MHYTHLGKTGLRVSRFCLGTMNFGPSTSEADSYAIMDAALDAGINFFDTADVYGRHPQMFQQLNRGATEEIIGRWFALGEGRRDAVILCTKVYNPMSEIGYRPEINRDQRSLSARKIIRHCEDSLRRLQTDWIDIYQLHHIDRNCPADEIWDAMQTLQRQGKIIYVGSSNFAGWDIATYCQIARQRGHLGLVSEQSKYSLTERSLELEVIPASRHYGLGVIPYSPLGGGVLAGGLKKLEQQDFSRKAFTGNVERHRATLEKWEALCAELGEEPGNVALAWILQQPGITAPIIGPRTLAQLTASYRALEIQLSPEVLQRIDEIWPGPGGSAPEAYAW